jgi:hypothetical protein
MMLIKRLLIGDFLLIVQTFDFFFVFFDRNSRIESHGKQHATFFAATDE